jgi:hypothetical protein
MHLCHTLEVETAADVLILKGGFVSKVGRRDYDMGWQLQTAGRRMKLLHLESIKFGWGAPCSSEAAVEVAAYFEIGQISCGRPACSAAPFFCGLKGGRNLSRTLSLVGWLGGQGTTGTSCARASVS